MISPHISVAKMANTGSDVAKTLVGLLLTTAGATLASQVADQAVSQVFMGIGINWTSEGLWNIIGLLKAQYVSKISPLGHAQEKAWRSAIQQLRKRYFEDFGSSDQDSSAFDQLERCTDLVQHFSLVVSEGNDVPGVDLESTLVEYLQDSSESVIVYIRNKLPSALSVELDREIRKDEEAWKSYVKLILEHLSSHQHEVTAALAELATKEQLETLDQRIAQGFFRIDQHLDSLLASSRQTALSEVEFDELLRDYARAVRAEFVSYWRSYVRGKGSTDTTLSRLEPVGQIFYCEQLRAQYNNRSPSGAMKGTSDTHGDDSDSPKRPVTAYTGSETLQSAFEEVQCELHKNGATLVGEPGAGKTLSLRYLTMQYSAVMSRHDAAVPIYLPLNEYRGEMSLLKFAKSYLGRHESRHFRRLAEYLDVIDKRRDVLFLLDGLNEIDERYGSPELIVTLIERFAHHQEAIYIISTRQDGRTKLPQAPVIELRSLDAEGLVQCINLYAAKHASELVRLLESWRIIPFASRHFAESIIPTRRFPHPWGSY